MFWALRPFLPNFVPFAGAVLEAIPAMLMALAQADLQTTLLVAFGYSAANTLIGINRFDWSHPFDDHPW